MDMSINEGYHIIDVTDSRWDVYANKMPLDRRDIYFLSEYYKLEEIENHGYPQMFVYESGNNVAIYPYLLNEIPYDYGFEGYYDIQTAYGYGGPITSTDDKDFIDSFEHDFLQFCKDNKIIAEFIRFHPLIGNQSIFSKNIEILHNRITVEVDLTREIDDIWMNQISTQNRNTIRKCLKNGLRVEKSNDYNAFVNIYKATMKKVSADEYYFFSESYFEQLKKSKNRDLFVVKYDGNVIAAAIFIGYGKYYHYHLSGSDEKYLKLAPNNILLWEAIKYAKEQGYEKLHLGGGRADSIEDALFKFKSHFSRNYKDFYIGKRIHFDREYKEIIAEWEKRNNKKAFRLLQYRE